MRIDRSIRVLVAEDDYIVAQSVVRALRGLGCEIVGEAGDGEEAISLTISLNPDLVMMDIEMPRMDGLTFLKRIMSQHPIPCVIISSLTKKGTKTALRAFEYGAVEIITKPTMYANEFSEESKIKIIDAVKAASSAKIKRIKKQISKKSSSDLIVEPKYSADAVVKKHAANKSMIKTTERMLNVGFDRNMGNNGKIFYNKGQGWLNSGFSGSLMIRPILGKALSSDPPVGIEHSPETKMNIYPNPASTYFELDLKDIASPAEWSVTLYDLQGKTVYINRADQQQHPVSHLPAGIYILRLDHHGIFKASRKLMIAR